MSRIGKIPVPIPSGVTVNTDGTTLTIKGPKGELTRRLVHGITAKVDAGALHLARAGNEALDRAQHGLARALAIGMIEGVSKGFERRLEVHGVSYQAAVEGQRLRLNVGFSHPVHVAIPKGIKVECPQPTQIVVTGCDKQLVGEFAATVRRQRKPEPYKGKGVRYLGEKIVQKAGKSFVGGEK
ncbi:MAG: 50S ribosomal protein L6 [Planctomycetia bacterium]